jgi:hypothetical protein
MFNRSSAPFRDRSMVMLKIRLMTVALLSVYFMLFGCGGGGGNDDFDAQAREDLVGTWRLAEGGQAGGSTVTCPGVIQTSSGTLACTNNTTITLNSNGSWTAFDGSTGTWSVSNGSLNAAYDQNAISGDITFESANRVRIQDNSGRFLTFVRVT